LVDRPYQLRFVTRLFLVLLAIAISSSLIAMAILWTNMYQPDIERQVHIISAFIGVAATLLIELLIAIPIVYYLGIRQSHQVVGPLKRMDRALETIGSGDFSPRLVLREGDVLEGLANSINRMAENLQKRYPKSPTGSA
jgi:nitrate/nitrite-specific signal transduction histidine kinase